jgi:hypothetical protein
MVKRTLLCVGFWWLIASAAARAVDLTAAFGSGAVTRGSLSSGCQLLASHAGSTFANAVNLIANGTDSAVITVMCQGVSFTQTIPIITVNGTDVANVKFPQTVTSSAPGVWVINIGTSSLSVIAQ